MQPLPFTESTSAHDVALLRLLELVSVVRVGRIREVRKQIQRVADRVQVEFCRGVRLPALQIKLKAVTGTLTAVGWVEVAKPIQEARLHRPERDLVGALPFAMVPHERQGDVVVGIALEVA